MISGHVDPRFARVRDEFERNFAERGDIGASVCVTVDGETVIDCWGGVADPSTGGAWKSDTVATVWSCTKGATALCAHMLADRGLIDFDAPVARYWPEFAANGKEGVTVRMLLNHQSGVAAWREPVPPNGLYDWERSTSALACQAPYWEPGTRHGYHALTFGHLVGEVVRRVTRQSLGQFFADEVAKPLGIDVWIGLPGGVESRVAPNIPHDPPQPDAAMPASVLAAMTDPSSLQASVYTNHGGFLDPGVCNTREAHAAEIPAANGIANARGLAGMYRPLALGGAYGSTRIVREDSIVAMSAVSSAGYDAFGLVPTRFSLGFNKAIDNRRQQPGSQESALISEDAFGHPGFGGSMGFADPGARMSFGYATNKQKSLQVLCDRGQALIHEVYRALGYTLAPNGRWYRCTA